MMARIMLGFYIKINWIGLCLRWVKLDQFAGPIWLVTKWKFLAAGGSGLMSPHA